MLTPYLDASLGTLMSLLDPMCFSNFDWSVQKCIIVARTVLNSIETVRLHDSHPARLGAP